MDWEQVAWTAVPVLLGVGLFVCLVWAYQEVGPEDRRGFSGKLQVVATAILTWLFGVIGVLWYGFLTAIVVVALSAVSDGLGWTNLNWLDDDEPKQEPTTAKPKPCDPSYPDECLNENATDYDCAGGEGDGPRYVTGPIEVSGSDPFGLDIGGTPGVGCE